MTKTFSSSLTYPLTARVVRAPQMTSQPVSSIVLCFKGFYITIIIYSLTAKVIGTPQMISQPVFSIFPCSPTPSGTWRTPGLSIPWCCLPTSSSVCSLPRLLPPFTVPCKMLSRPDERETSLYDRQEVFVWSNCLLDLGTDFLVGNMVFV